MDKAEKHLFNFIDYVGHIAGSLDSTSWIILAVVSVVAGFALMKGPGIQGA